MQADLLAIFEGEDSSPFYRACAQLSSFLYCRATLFWDAHTQTPRTHACTHMFVFAGHGHRPHLAGEHAEGAAWHGDRPGRLGPAQELQAAVAPGAAVQPARAQPGAHYHAEAGVRGWPYGAGAVQAHQRECEQAFEDGLQVLGLEHFKLTNVSACLVVVRRKDNWILAAVDAERKGGGVWDLREN
eukprot:881020-Pelagomonas_calceolata.AAC.1